MVDKILERIIIKKRRHLPTLFYSDLALVFFSPTGLLSVDFSVFSVFSGLLSGAVLSDEDLSPEGDLWSVA